MRGPACRVPAITGAQRERLGVVGVTGLESMARKEIDLGPRGRLVLYENDSVEFLSDEHPFSEWRSEDGRLLREEIARARAAISLSIVEDVWLGKPKRSAGASPSPS